jgi:hypothetical protein
MLANHLCGIQYDDFLEMVPLILEDVPLDVLGPLASTQ